MTTQRKIVNDEGVRLLLAACNCNVINSKDRTIYPW